MGGGGVMAGVVLLPGANAAEHTLKQHLLQWPTRGHQLQRHAGWRQPAAGRSVGTLNPTTVAGGLLCACNFFFYQHT